VKSFSLSQSKSTVATTGKSSIVPINWAALGNAVLGSSIADQPQSFSPVQAKPQFRGLSHELGLESSPTKLIQAKLAIGQSNDQYEQEADQVATQVVQQINTPASSKSSVPTQNQAPNILQLKPQPQFSSPVVDRPPSTLESSIQQNRTTGQPLPDLTRASMEQAFGHDFSNVKIHADAQADQLNRSLQARAFTSGQDIFFRQGEYQPESMAGQTILAHELTHVVQQNSHQTSSTTMIQRVQYSGHGLLQDYDTNKLDDWRKKVDSLAKNKKDLELDLLYQNLVGDLRSGKDEQNEQLALKILLKAIKFVDPNFYVSGEVAHLINTEIQAPSLSLLSLPDEKPKQDQKLKKDKEPKSQQESTPPKKADPAEGERVLSGVSGGKKKVFGDLEKQDLLQRSIALDYNLLTQIAAKAPLIEMIENTDLDAEEKDLLKQMILVSTRSLDTLKAALKKVIDTKKENRQQPIGKLIRKLADKKSLPSNQVYHLIAECRQIINDVFRLGGIPYDFAAAAKQEQTLDHQEKGRFGSKHKTHSESDVASKVRTIAKLNLSTVSSAYVSDLPSPTIAHEGEKSNLKITEPHVAVAGGGPIGLMAAIEARLQGAQVTVFEGREQQYSRRQVLKLEDLTIQKLRKFGVYEELFGKQAPKGNEEISAIAVKYVEKALKRRALELGIKIETGFYLTNAQMSKKSPDLELELEKGEEKRTQSVQLLIVAVGPGINKPDKRTGVVLKDQLGFEYDVKKVVDYAVTGLMETTQEGKTGHLPKESQWKYRFDTPKVTYLLHQIPKDLYDKFAQPGNNQLMQAYVLKAAKEHHNIQNPQLAKTLNNRGEPTQNVGIFKIEIQQAKQFVSKTLPALVIGDSAATPHPDSGSGLNMGVAEIDALGDVVQALRQERLRQLKARTQSGNTPQSPQEQQEASLLEEAFKTYNQELKSLTDTLVDKAMMSFQEIHSKRLNSAIAEFKKTHDHYLNLKQDQMIAAEFEKLLQQATVLKTDKTNREQAVYGLIDLEEKLQEMNIALLEERLDQLTNQLTNQLTVRNPPMNANPSASFVHGVNATVNANPQTRTIVHGAAREAALKKDKLRFQQGSYTDDWEQARKREFDKRSKK
jgi:Domain of unknown function (DUF4157)/FAD binding domain